MILLKQVREARGQSQQELARESGIPQQTISSLESGTRTNPGIETLWPLAKALGCEVGALYRPDQEGGETEE